MCVREVVREKEQTIDGPSICMYIPDAILANVLSFVECHVQIIKSTCLYIFHCLISILFFGKGASSVVMTLRISSF